MLQPLKTLAHLFMLFSLLAVTLGNLAEAAPAQAVAGRCYVKWNAKGSNNGASWANAYTKLQSALEASRCTEIWVARGTYKPSARTDPADPRSTTFALKNKVALYGGFAGTETQRSQRKWETNLTLLSGDIGKAGIKADNAYHVITGSDTNKTAVLDGFTISQGNANGADPQDAGGGMFNDSGNPMLANVIFSSNTALYRGGGMFNGNYSSPTLTNVIFSENMATGEDGGGGGMYNENYSRPTLTSVTFSSNTAGYGGGMFNSFSNPTLRDTTTFINNTATRGGGVYNVGSNPTLTDVTFSDNTADLEGGGMYNGYVIDEGGSNPTLTNVTFSDNTATQGGGMLNDNSSPTLVNVTFDSNTADHYGGGMYSRDSSRPTLTNAAFSGNSADWGGGGIYNVSSSPMLTNGTFSSNLAAHYGGGMYNDDTSSPTLTNITFSGNSANWGGGGIYNVSSNPTLTNVTFSGNSANYGGGMDNHNSGPMLINVTFSANMADHGGGGMCNRDSSSPTLYNSLLWGDTDNEIYNDNSNGASIPVINDSLVQGGCPEGATCNSNIIVTDPKLGTLGNYGGPSTSEGQTTLTIPLLPGSAAIDAGDDATCAATDQRGITRPQGAHCDIGAYEVGPILYAKPGGATSGSACDSWEGACELNYALINSVPGQEIWAAAGTYKPTSGTDRTATFQLKSGVALYGGFVGTETARDQRNPAANVTLLSGDLNGDDGPDFTNRSDNGDHVVTGHYANNSVLDGFTIRGGYATSPGEEYGGGFTAYAAQLKISNVIFDQNYSAFWGGGLYVNDGSLTMENVTFSGNQAAAGGGLVLNRNSHTLSEVTFENNIATSGNGGGIYTFNAPSLTLTKATFNGNQSTNSNSSGGAIAIGGGELNVIDSTFSDNSADWGGAIDNWGVVTITGSTFSNNEAVHNNGGAICSNPAITVTDSTFTNNRAYGPGGALSLGSLGTSNVTGSTFDNNKSTTSIGGAISAAQINVMDSTISGNSAQNGGGLSLTNGSNVSTLSNVTFNGNSATHGGGLFNDNSSPTLTNVTFVNNEGQFGGGMKNINSSSPILSGVTFNANTAASYGGGMLNNSGSPTLENVTFYANTANYGGGMYNVASSTPALKNVTFTQNNAAISAGGLSNYMSSVATINNSIFWDNTAPTNAQVHNDSGSSTISNSVIQDGCPTGSTCPDIITADPKFGPLSDNGGSTLTVPLLSDSSAIDTGNNATCPPLDQRGVKRPAFGVCDIGAYELDTFTVTINQAEGQADPALDDMPVQPINFKAVFSRSVTGFGAETTDLTLSDSTTPGALGGTVTEIAPNDGTTYNVAVNGMSGHGKVTVSIPPGAAQYVDPVDTRQNTASASTDNMVKFGIIGVSITAQPSSVTDQSTAKFSFESNENIASFFCKLDYDASFSPCASPLTKKNVALGLRTFSIKARDVLGNFSAEQSYTWYVHLVDAIPPTAKITAYRGRLWSNNLALAPLKYIVTFSEPVQPLTRKMLQISGTASASITSVKKTGTGTYQVTVTPRKINATTFKNGTIQIKILAGKVKDLAGNFMKSSPVPPWLHYDTQTPLATIKLPRPAKQSSQAQVTFTFKATENSIFYCRLDTFSPVDHWERCSALPVKDGSWTVNVPDGARKFSVYAEDQAGNQSKARAYTWEVDTTPPAIDFTNNPLNPTNLPNADFQFTVADEGVGIAETTCRLDESEFTACSSSTSYPGLPDGNHIFEVHAKDLLENASSAQYTWLVDTIPPAISIAPDSTSVTIIVTDDSGSGIAAISCHLTGTDNDDNPIAWDGANAQCNNISFAALNLKQGSSYHIDVQATDNASNIGEEQQDGTVPTSP